MKLLMAKNAGFCFGVERAVDLANKLAEPGDARIYTLGEIIHNHQVVDRLKSKGVTVVNSPDEIEEEGGVLIIRAHGAPPDMLKAYSCKVRAIRDATCPYVKKIHDLVSLKQSQGYEIFIIGDSNHPEVIGINGWCRGAGHIVFTESDLDKPEVLKLDTHAKVCAVCQTTITEEIWSHMTALLRQRFPEIELHRTICSATARRQDEAVRLAKQSDVMLVIGEHTSSNTRKLYEICKKIRPETYLVGGEDEIPNIDKTADITVGVTAGASAPDWLITQIIEKLQAT